MERALPRSAAVCAGGPELAKQRARLLFVVGEPEAVVVFGRRALFGRELHPAYPTARAPHAARAYTARIHKHARGKQRAWETSSTVARSSPG